MFAWRDNFISYAGSSAANDPFWSSVVFLQNNEYPSLAFVDDSTNNFPISVFADVKPSLKSPFATGVGGSMYYDGSGDYITAPDSDQFYLTGDFTLEGWVYMTTGSGRRTIVCQWPGVSATNCSWVMEVGTTGRVVLSYGIGVTNAQIIGTSLTVSSNAWHHVAITRQGSTVRLFSDGVQDATTGTVAGALNNSTGPVNIGRNGDNSNYLTGFISNVRVINGTALYTSNFTPSTVPLTPVTGTSLLVTGTNQGLLNNSTFIDSATTSTAALSLVSTPRYSGRSPFGNSYPGSASFTGTNYMTAVSNTGYNINGDFTVEAWVYPNNVTGNKAVGGINSAGAGWYMGLSGATTRFSSGATNYDFGTISASTWTHLAAVRNGNNLTFYINGVQSGSPVDVSAQNWNITQALWIGNINSAGWNFNGYITNFRITKAAVYTSNFTPSTTPLGLEATTTFLLRCNGGLQDLSNNGQQISNTTSTFISTQQEKFGVQSVSLVPSNNQLLIDNATLRFTGNFTIEGWIYRSTVGTTQSLFSKGGTTTGWTMTLNVSNQIEWTSGTTILKTSSTTIPINTWTYIALSRTSGTCYMFINGTQEGSSFIDATSYTETNSLIIGASRTGLTGFNGYMDDIRITNGVGRYTSSFSAPTTSFPTS